jgi:hypothetical protein
VEYLFHGFLACRPISTNLSPRPHPDLATFALRGRIEKPANPGWYPGPPLTFLTHPRVARRTPYPNHPLVAPVSPENNRTAGTAKNSRGTTWKIVPPQRIPESAEDSLDTCSTLCYIVRMKKTSKKRNIIGTEFPPDLSAALRTAARASQRSLGFVIRAACVEWLTLHTVAHPVTPSPPPAVPLAPASSQVVPAATREDVRSADAPAYDPAHPHVTLRPGSPIPGGKS